MNDDLLSERIIEEALIHIKKGPPTKDYPFRDNPQSFRIETEPPVWPEDHFLVVRILEAMPLIGLGLENDKKCLSTEH